MHSELVKVRGKGARSRRSGKPRRRVIQKELVFRPEGQRRGGRRPGAGRPKKPGSGVPHRTRKRLTRHVPVHVTLRLKKSVRACLRRRHVYTLLRRALRLGARRWSNFRICEFSVQHNHIHLIAEAHSAEALSRGMQGLGIRMTRALNGRLRRRGSVWADRYHEVQLTSPRQVRNALVYVLNNGRHHVQSLHALGERVLSPRWTDGCSSADTFDGWKGECARWLPARPPPERRVTVAARSHVLTRGWRRHGLLHTADAPAAR